MQRGQEYRGSTDRPIGSRASVRDNKVILDKTGAYGYTITKDTAVMFAPLFSFYASNIRYKGRIIESDSEIHNASIFEMNNSSVMFANIYDISNNSPSKEDLLSKSFDNNTNLRDHLVESPIFNLYIPEDSLLADKFDVPLERGKEYTKMLVYGAFLIIQFKNPGRYQIDFGGIGLNTLRYSFNI